MPTGVDQGLAGTLFRLNMKVNCQDRGFQTKLNLVGANYAAVITPALLIAAAYRKTLPSDAEIYYATISMDNTKRDSKYLPGALGQGGFVGAGVDPDPTLANAAWDAIKVRLENEDGGQMTVKIGPVPDAVIDGGGITDPIDAVTSTFAGADPTLADGTVYKTAFTNLLKLITKYCFHVRSGHAPGGVFTYWALTAAYPLGVAKKKGGRVFV